MSNGVRFIIEFRVPILPTAVNDHLRWLTIVKPPKWCSTRKKKHTDHANQTLYTYTYCTHIHIHTHPRTHTHIHTHTYAHTHIHIIYCIHIYIYIYTHIYKTYIYTYTHHIYRIYRIDRIYKIYKIYIHTSIHLYTYTPWLLQVQAMSSSSSGASANEMGATYVATRWCPSSWTLSWWVYKSHFTMVYGRYNEL